MQFQIDAMNCGGCARSVTKAIHSVDPQAKIDVNLTMKRVIVDSGADEDTIAGFLSVQGILRVDSIYRDGLRIDAAACNELIRCGFPILSHFKDA